ncbi:FAD linked oxidase domain protein [Syntrophobotulus glycolicus DSM 8271]|uniref:D-lactate dehydrogenase (cytochrome) n=1 Tax=Syntrophobotulus glycolicus (strain DSM 8271 / FlGlyR) TaxID=645991 RepID=F0SW18_SYNGF|nr:FAD-binding oxidoreductase [Syntrophobotulus glycolicus]ADY56802.1 FAD linked oxidase domain protein [Syntrophobotulus glycolicus DSM 8271]
MSDIVSKLKSIVGDQNVETSNISQYLRGNEQPAAVVFPSSTEEVSKIVIAANEANVKINVGGKVVETKGLKGGIAVVMSKMSAIEEIDHENLTCWVQAGMNHQELVEKLASEKLYFAPEPYAVSTSSIAGCFAIGDTDSKAFNYLPTRTYILAYESVLPTGEIYKVGTKCIKCVSGYDMIHFIVGTRATLGIITKVLVKLLPVPKVTRAVIADMPSLNAAAVAFKSIQKRRILPTRMNAVSKALGNIMTETKGGALVFVDIESYPVSAADYAKTIEAELRIAGATATKIVEDKAEYDEVVAKWLLIREKVNLEQNTVKFTVGPAKVTNALSGLTGIVGNLDENPGVLVEGLNGKIAVFTKKPDADAVAINKVAMSFGGNISGLLGSQLRCKAYNDNEMLGEISRILNSVRSEFDPKGIMAPGIKL